MMVTIITNHHLVHLLTGKEIPENPTAQKLSSTIRIRQLMTEVEDRLAQMKTLMDEAEADK